MRGLFNFDSPLMQFLTKVADLIILNLLFLVTSVPVITIGASATALHYVALRMIHGQEGPITRDYFRSFRTNFRQATAIWLLLLGFALIAFLNSYILEHIFKKYIPQDERDIHDMRPLFADEEGQADEGGADYSMFVRTDAEAADGAESSGAQEADAGSTAGR